MKVFVWGSVRDYAKGFNQLAKTDPVDARVLACYGRERQPRLMDQDDKQDACDEASAGSAA